MEFFDTVIIGAGSAGCVLADRLSASGRHRVLLLERGPRDRSPWIHMPVGYGKLFYHRRLNYRLQAEPAAGLQGRSDYWPRGRVVGGSGAINAMVYCRGLAQDFDDWQAAGASGWGWQAVRDTYERIEQYCDAAGERHGAGPIRIRDPRAQLHRANRHFFAALDQAGLPLTDNLNGAHPEGGASYPVNIHKGRRWGAAQAHLAPALKRKNLELRSSARVERILFDAGRASGVELFHRGRRYRVQAGQVILSAGAVHSPQILQLSGIGPGARLQRHGIKVWLDNPNVGGNLQDHLGINYLFKAAEPTLNSQLAPWHGKLWAGLRYVLARRGPLALSVNQCGGFLRSHPDLAQADQQLYFNPVTYTTARVGKRTIIHPDPFPGFILGMQPCRPTSRGRIDITSPDPAVAPRIATNALSSEVDQQAAVAGAQLCARILRSPALTGLIKSPLGPDPRQMTPAEMLEDFQARAGSVFHPVGSCRMGATRHDSVVDPTLRVHGVAGLYVVDASAFPNITSGNTNAPTMMLAHRAADLILERSA